MYRYKLNKISPCRIENASSRIAFSYFLNLNLSRKIIISFDININTETSVRNSVKENKLQIPNNIFLAM